MSYPAIKSYWGRGDGLQVFAVIWIGQLVSLVGSALTGFTLGVWVYQRNGLVMEFALILLFTTLPGVILSPLAGMLADSWNRRWIMMLSDAGAALGTLIVLLLLRANRLEVFHIYIAVATNAAFSAFQWPAYAASISMLVPRRHLGRANGMMQFGQAFAQLTAPLLGGLLALSIGLSSVLLIDLATFLFAILTLLIVRIPQVSQMTTSLYKTGYGSMLRGVTYGWRYISARPGLAALLLFSATNNFLVDLIFVLSTPFILSLASVAVLGTILSIAGSGMLVGSVVMTAWGGPERRINGVFSFALLGGLCILIAGLWRSVWLFAAIGFVFSFRLPILRGSRDAIWQSKVAPEAQGRVFATRRMVAWLPRPLAYLMAGTLVDQVFEPLLASDGPLANSIGRIIGIMPGREIGLLFVLVGVFMILTVVAGYLYRRLRLVEDELADVSVFAFEAPAPATLS